MSNYLSEIETEYSRGRGRASQLSPLDWQLAGNWETDGIPLRIVLSAMGDGFKKFAAQNRKDEISSLRYFIPMVNKTFAEWQTSQIGKSNEVKSNPMKDECFAAYACADHTDVLEDIVECLDGRNDPPEPLRSTIAVTKGEILALLDQATQNQLSTDDIETRLGELRAELEIALIASISDDERARIVAETKAEYGKFTLLPGVESKVLIRKLYEKFGLPELSLFAF